MDLSLERENSAFGSLFQQIINDLKNTSPLWEDFLTKATKLHQCLRAAIQAIAAYLDAFQKIADAATNSRGASKEIGTALTRVCLRHKAVESRLKTFTTAIMDCLVQPLQEKLEDWKRTVITIDKEHAKEYKRCRTELKKRSSDTLRLQKKARKGQSDTIQSLVDTHMQDVTLRRAELEEVEKKSLRSAMVEERLRYCTFVHMLQPVVKEECEVMSELGHLQEAMDSIAIVTKDPSVLPQASEELIHDTKATITLYPESPGGGSSSQGGCSNSLGSRKSSVCSISSMNSSGSSNSPGHHHYPRSLSQLISPAIRLKPGESSDSGFCSSPALTTQASTATSQSHAASTWPPHCQDAVPVLPPAADRPHTISTSYEKGHQRPPLTVYTFQNPETILEGSSGSGSIPGTPSDTSGGANSGANTPSIQKSSAGSLSRPPLPVRCSSLERPLTNNNNRSTSNLLQRQCPSPIPAHITKELSAHYAQQQQQQQQQQKLQQPQQQQSSATPPTYVNMSELANMAALKITTHQQQQQTRPIAGGLQQQHSIDSISSQFSNDSTTSGHHNQTQQNPQQQFSTRSHSISSSSASSNTPSLHSHPSIDSGTVTTPLVGQTPTPSSGSSTPQNHYSPLLTNSPSSTAAGTPSGGSMTSGMISGFVYNVNSPTPPQSCTASIDNSDVLKITETDGGRQIINSTTTNEINAQQQELNNLENVVASNLQITTDISDHVHTNSCNETSNVVDTESSNIVENDERSRASVLQKASMFEKQAAAVAASTVTVATGRSNADAIYGTRRNVEDVYRTPNTSNCYQQSSEPQQQQREPHSEQQDVDTSFEDSIQELNNLIGELDSFQREIDASKRSTDVTPTTTITATIDNVDNNCDDRSFPSISTDSICDDSSNASKCQNVRSSTSTLLTIICPSRPPKSPQCSSGRGTDLSDATSDEIGEDSGKLGNRSIRKCDEQQYIGAISRDDSEIATKKNGRSTLQQYNSESELSETSPLAGGYENPTFAHYTKKTSSSSIAASSGVDEPLDVGSAIGDSRSLMAVSSTTTGDDSVSHTSETYLQHLDTGSDGGSNVVVIYDHQIPITPDIDYVKQNSEIVLLRTNDPLQQKMARQEMHELTQLPANWCVSLDVASRSALSSSSSSLSCSVPTSPPHIATVAPAKQRLSSFRASSEQQLQLIGSNAYPGTPNNSQEDEDKKRDNNKMVATPNAHNSDTIIRSKATIPPKSSLSIFNNGQTSDDNLLENNKTCKISNNSNKSSNNNSSSKGICDIVEKRLLVAPPPPPPPPKMKANFKADLDAKIRKQKLKLQLQHEQQQHQVLLQQKQQLLQEQQQSQKQHSPQSTANNTNSPIIYPSNNNHNHNHQTNNESNEIISKNTNTNTITMVPNVNRNSSDASRNINSNNNKNSNSPNSNRRIVSAASTSNSIPTKTLNACSSSASTSSSAYSHNMATENSSKNSQQLLYENANIIPSTTLSFRSPSIFSSTDQIQCQSQFQSDIMAPVLQQKPKHDQFDIKIITSSSSTSVNPLSSSSVSATSCTYMCSATCMPKRPVHTKPSAASATVSSSTSASNSTIAKPNVTPRPASLSGGVTRIARRSSVNTAKPPPPVRRSSSVTPSHNATSGGVLQSYQQNQNHVPQQPTASLQNTQFDSVDCLPPPPAFLLDSRQSQTTPTPPPAPFAISTTTITTTPSSSLKVAETVKALSAIRHKPASPNSIRHMQQQHNHQHRQQQQQQQHQHPTLQLHHFDAYSYYNPFVEVETQLTATKNMPMSINNANSTAAYSTLSLTPNYNHDDIQPIKSQQQLQQQQQQQQQQQHDSPLQDPFGNNTLRTPPLKTTTQPKSPSYTSPPPYDFQHSKVELPPPLPPPNPNQQRHYKQSGAIHQHTIHVTTTTQHSHQQNSPQQQKRHYEQLYDYLPSQQHRQASPKQQFKQEQQQYHQHQQKQSLSLLNDALVDNDDETTTLYDDNGSFRTSSPGIYAQPKIVTSMSSFRSASPAPNDHHNQHHHVIPPTQPKTNPNLIAQLNARLSKQNQQQQQNSVSEGTYGSTPSSPNHHNHQHRQSEPVYMGNYTHPYNQQQQQQTTTINVSTMHQQQQNHDGKSNIDKHNKVFGSFSNANATQSSQASTSGVSVSVTSSTLASSSTSSISHFSHSSTSSSNTANFNASPHFPLSSSTSSLLSKVSLFATNASSTAVALSSPTPTQVPQQLHPTSTVSHYHTSSRDHYHHNQHQLQHNQYESITSQNAAQFLKEHPMQSNIYSSSSSSPASTANTTTINKNPTVAQTTTKHQQSYTSSGGAFRHCGTPIQLQQQQHHYRESHHSCPPPLENPPPPPNNSAIYAANANVNSTTMPKNVSRGSSSASGDGINATYAPPSATMTLPKNLAQQRLQQQQHYHQQQQQQQQQYHHSAVSSGNSADQQQPQSQTAIVNQRAQMPISQQQQHKQQQQQQLSYKQKSATLQSSHRQPSVQSRNSSVQQKILVATNPFIQTTTMHCHSPASVHSQPASPTCSSPSSLASIYGTSSRNHHHHHYYQQQQQQQQHQGNGNNGGAGGNSTHHIYYAAPHNSTGYASSNIEKAGSIRSKTKAEFLENLNAKLAKQGLSGRAFAVRNLINSKALPDPRICHESLMDQIKRGATLKRNQKINDRSAPKIH